MTVSRIDARFLDGKRGKIFVLLRRPDRDSGRSVLIVPPFAEEMNKSRKMFTDVAQALARCGIGTILPDLFGTGDSEGEFRDGDWEIWKDDLARAAAFAAEQGCPVNALLCERLGCALGAEAARDTLGGVDRTVFWQPVLDGQRFMTQFLRLRVAASMMEDRKETVGGLRERLQAGDTLEVAGYELAARLVDRIDRVRLAAALGSQLGDLHWLELVRDADGPLPGASEEAVSAARPRMSSVTMDALVGEPFWSATEIVRIPALVDRTVAVLAMN